MKQALFRAVSLRRPPPAVIQHTDRGSQYCSHEYRALVAWFGMQASMSLRGGCYDQAPIESIRGARKNELMHRRRYATREQARLSFLSPAACRQQYPQQSTAA